MTYGELSRRASAYVPDTPRRYALAVPVAEERGELMLLFEVRAAGLRIQPGEVCLPGGGVEPGESFRQAAVRELYEELGLTAPMAIPDAPLPRVWHQAGFSADPFLVKLAPGWRDALRPNPDEVGSVFTVPLSFFRETPPEIRTVRLLTRAEENFPYERIGFPDGYRWREGTMSVPIWVWEGRPIWGMTGRVIQNLVDAL